MEKKLDIAIYRLSGKSGPSDKQWSTTFVYEPPDEESKRLRGTLFVVLDLSSSGSIDLPLASKLTLDVLSEEYYSDKEGSPLKALEKALLSSRHRLVNVAFGPEKGSATSEINFNIVAAVLWGTVVYIAKIGSVASHLLRDDKIQEIGPTKESNISVASGIVKAGDTIIIGTRKFKETVPPQNISRALPTLKKASEELSFSKEINGGEEDIKVKNAYPVSLSMILLEFQLRDVPGEEEILQISDAELNHKRLPFRFALKNIKIRLRNLLVFIKKGESFKRLIGRIMVRFGSRGGQIYIKRSEEPLVTSPSQHSRRFLLVTFLLSLIFIVSVVFTISRRRSQAHSAEVARLMDEARINIDKAEDLVDLNNIRAKEHLEEAFESLDSAYGLIPKPIAELDNLRQEAQELFDAVRKIVRLKEPDLFYDFTIQSKEANPVSIVGGGGSIFVADRGEGVVYRLREEDGIPKVEKASIDPVKNPRSIIPGTGRLFVLGDGGLSLLNLKDGSVIDATIDIDEDFSSIVSMDIYIDSIYLMSTNSNQIYRTTVSGNDFSDPVNWIEEDSNFEDAVSMSIDGDIYVLKRISGEILKFSQGRQVEFKLQELDTAIKEPSVLYTTPDSPSLYILDNGNKRVIIVSKQGGLYQRQFVYTGEENIWKDLKGLWVDEESTILYVLDGTRVYKIDY